MKLKKSILFGLALAMTAGSAVTLAACGKTNEEVSAQDFYAMAALSSVNYLQEKDETLSISTAKKQRALAQGDSRPQSVSQQDVQSLSSYMDMFQDMLATDTTKYFTNSEVTQDDEYYQTYNLKMTFTIPTNDGQQDLVMYYKEVRTDTHEEIDDDEVELEVNTTLEGVLVDGENAYDVVGMREYEKEGRETEVSYEFTTYSKQNRSDYVRIEHEKDNEEIEYQYSIYKNGIKTSETQVEFENERGKKSLELEFKTNQTQVKYEITKRSQNVYQVRLKNVANKDEVKEVFTIEVTGQGYIFQYANGFSETV